MRFKVTVAYNGANFVGWQRQSKGRTVQKTIEDIISVILNKPAEITSSGRTDAKVSAVGQVFHFDSDLNIQPSQWQKALNAQLPEDIYIKDVCEVSDEFHARFNVVSKRYDYCIQTGNYDVLSYPFVFQLNRPLDLEKMRECAMLFIGEHDFTSFNATPLEMIPYQIRTIKRLDIIDEVERVRLIFEGKGFLRYMVRMITQVLIEVGLNRLTKDDVIRMFEENNKEACKLNAPPQGLTLVEVRYSDR
jgi:tRNA pseudouridine38-40 synthase